MVSSSHWRFAPQPVIKKWISCLSFSFRAHSIRISRSCVRPMLPGVLQDKSLRQIECLRQFGLRTWHRANLVNVRPIGYDNDPIRIQTEFVRHQIAHISSQDDDAIDPSIESCSRPRYQTHQETARTQHTRSHKYLGIDIMDQKQAPGASQPACKSDQERQRRRIGHDQDDIMRAEIESRHARRSTD